MDKEKRAMELLNHIFHPIFDISPDKFHISIEEARLACAYAVSWSSFYGSGNNVGFDEALDLIGGFSGE